MNKCPICGKGDLHKKVTQETTKYKGHIGSLPLYFSVCDFCGSEQSNAEQINANKLAMETFKDECRGEVRIMATQGVVSILQKGKMFIKVIAGSNGNKALDLANWVKEAGQVSPSQVYEKAQEIGFGSKYSLVVQYLENNKLCALYDEEEIEQLSKYYVKKFYIPSFNPRWANGGVEHIQIVELK